LSCKQKPWYKIVVKHQNYHYHHRRWYECAMLKHTHTNGDKQDKVVKKYGEIMSQGGQQAYDPSIPGGNVVLQCPCKVQRATGVGLMRTTVENYALLPCWRYPLELVRFLLWHCCDLEKNRQHWGTFLLRKREGHLNFPVCDQKEFPLPQLWRNPKNTPHPGS